MKKYNTRPIDFTGCHPVIAEHLKRGEEIRCWAWDQDCAEKPNSCHEVWIVGYWQTAYYPYRAGGDSFFCHAEPIPRKVRRIMPPERAIPVLIKNGYAFDALGYLRGERHFIIPPMFEKMGKPLEDNSRSWPSCIIEDAGPPCIIEDAWPSCIIEEVEDE